MKQIPFTKMEGLGNDYIYINGFEVPVNDLGDISKLAQKLSDRHFGIGGDGLILILPSESADARMRMFNADGSEGEMCGNALRCVARFLYERLGVKKRELMVETKAGIRNVFLELFGEVVSMVSAGLGEPILSPQAIPVAHTKDERLISIPIYAEEMEFRITPVSMGNPHGVIFVDEVTDDLVSRFGPQFENHAFFPKRSNIEFVKVLDRQNLEMRVWERGSGETLACGTGAAATCVAAVLNGLTEKMVTVHLRGGNLRIIWEENNHVTMKGPATFVFDGIFAYEK